MAEPEPEPEHHSSRAPEPEQPPELDEQYAQYLHDPAMAAADVVLQALMPVASSADLDEMGAVQKQTVMRLHRAVEALAIFNTESEEQFKVLGPKFQAKGKQLVLIKAELDGIFKRIGKLKSTMQERYPNAYRWAENDVKKNFLPTLKKKEDDVDPYLSAA